MSHQQEQPWDGALRLLPRAAKSKGYTLEKVEALYPYCDASGTPSFYRVRGITTDGKKFMRPMRIEGDRFTLREPKHPSTGKPLYCWPRVREASPDIPVVVCEGEKCADLLAAMGLVAVTSGSSDSAHAADWSPLACRRVLVFPDADAAGRKYAQAVAAKLVALGCDVQVIDVEAVGLTGKDDAEQWLDRNPGATVADLLALPLLPSPVFSEGNSGNSGNTAPDKALPRSQMVAPAGNGGNADVPCQCFELLEHANGGRMAGVYWYDVVHNAQSGSIEQAPPLWICSPLRVQAMTRDAQGGEWGRLLVFPDRDGRVHRWTMPMELLAGNGEELRRELLREGLTITSSARDRVRLVDYIMRSRSDVTAQCVRRTGWHGDVFVLPRETFGDTEAEPVHFQAATMEGVALGQAGTLAEWVEQVAARCAGNTRLVLALCAGFAGPCLGLLHMDGGGFHFRGGSSTGKTTALHLAASLYGSPDYLRTWRHTDNALEGVAGMHSDLLLVLDEMGELAPKIAGHTAYMLANGQGKGRAARDGSPRALTTWRVLFLSSGEVALADLVTQSGGKIRAGQMVRVIDLPADAGAGHGIFDTVPEGMSAGAFADVLKTASATHYGHALPAFLRQLVADPGKARAVLAALRDGIADHLIGENATGQVRRVAQRFALVAAAGELATDYGLTGWSVGEARRAAAAGFAAWMAGRGTVGASEPVAMLDQVRLFLSAHGEARFTAWSPLVEPPRTINRAGFVQHGDDGPTYYIEPEVFKREVCAGFDAALVAKALLDMKALDCNEDRLTKRARLPDGRNTRMYVVLPALWGDA